MITTIQTVFEGRAYEVVADSDKAAEPMCNYVQIYRIRKDGSRGRHLQAWRPQSWQVWVSVRDQVKAREAA
jgi:hypothetical protein